MFCGTTGSRVSAGHTGQPADNWYYAQTGFAQKFLKRGFSTAPLTFKDLKSFVNKKDQVRTQFVMKWGQWNGHPETKMRTQWGPKLGLLLGAVDFCSQLCLKLSGHNSRSWVSRSPINAWLLTLVCMLTKPQPYCGILIRSLSLVK